MNHGFTCCLCGRTFDALYVPSEIMLKANCGSAYDMATIRLEICGACADRLFSAVFAAIGAGE